MDNYIEELTIPNSLEYIEDYDFEGNKIRKIIIDTEKSSLKNIGRIAFGKIEVKELKLNKNLEKISSSAFKNSEIKELDLSLSENLKVIEEEAFPNASINILKLNDNLEEISKNAFFENAINEFDTPKNLKTIGTGHFKVI